MNDMRGIADESKPRSNESTRNPQPERMRVARAGDRNIAEREAKAPLERGMKFSIGQGDDAVRFPAFFRPYNGRSPSGQRQNRKRSRQDQNLL